MPEGIMYNAVEAPKGEFGTILASSHNATKLIDVIYVPQVFII